MSAFSGIPTTRVPLFYAAVDNSQASYFQRIQPALLIGQMDEAVGAATPGERIEVSTVNDAIAKFGPGSMLTDMVRIYRKADTFGELHCLPLADADESVAAAGAVTFTGPATGSGVLPARIAGQAVPVTVAVGDTAAEVATAFAAAINALTSLPVTAEVNGEDDTTVDITALSAGSLGNDIDIRFAYLGGLGGESMPAGIAAEITDMADGAGDPDLATALAVLGDSEFDFIAQPYTDTTNLDAVKAFMNDATGRWAFDRQVYGHVFSARRGTVGALATFGNARNDQHVCVMGFDGSPTPCWGVAAAFAAAAAPALRDDPARPLQTLPLAGVLAPPDDGSRFTLQECNSLLFDGVAVSTVTADGTVVIYRAVTTYQVNAYGVPDPSYLDVTTLATLQIVLRRLKGVVTQKWPRHKLANDGTRFGPGQAMVTPAMIRDELIAEYKRMEFDGLVENTDLFKQHLIVERDSNDPNRINVLWPGDLVNQLRVFALVAQFRLDYPAITA